MAVRQTLGDMNDSIRHTGVPVKATMPESAIVQADSGKLYRVLQNILDNALRYSLVGTRIYLEVSRGDIATRLTLTNTASYEMNFAPDDVLQRFVRGDASRTTEGSGLGLSIAQSFMQNFGGGLEVGVQGDTFTVTLTFPGSAAAGNGAAPARQDGGVRNSGDLRRKRRRRYGACGGAGCTALYARRRIRCGYEQGPRGVRRSAGNTGTVRRLHRHPGHRACAKSTRRHVQRSEKRTRLRQAGRYGRLFPVRRSCGLFR